MSRSLLKASRRKSSFRILSTRVASIVCKVDDVIEVSAVDHYEYNGKVQIISIIHRDEELGYPIEVRIIEARKHYVNVVNGKMVIAWREIKGIYINESCFSPSK